MSESTILYPVSNTSREEFLAKKKRQKQFITGMRLFILIFILGGWEIAARCHLIDDFLFSSPTRILKVMVQMAADKSLFYHIGITIGETLISFILVLILGTFISMLLWWCHSAADILEPYLVVLNSLPKTALAPILIVWLGNNMKTIIVCGVTMAIFSTIINLYTAFIGEFLAANAGLGYLIIYGSQVFRLDYVMLSIIILCVLAMILYQLLAFVEKRYHAKH